MVAQVAQAGFRLFTRTSSAHYAANQLVAKSQWHTNDGEHQQQPSHKQQPSNEAVELHPQMHLLEKVLMDLAVLSQID